MKIILSNKRFDVDTALLQKVADTCEKVEGLQKRLFINLYLCTNAEIRKINYSYRNIDKPTDVLSFPSIEYPSGTLKDNSILLSEVYDDEENAYFIGDSFISIERTIEQAQEYGHSFRRELAFLLTHSIFHLFGYDHMNPADEKQMIMQQNKVLKHLKIDR